MHDGGLGTHVNGQRVLVALGCLLFVVGLGITALGPGAVLPDAQERTPSDDTPEGVTTDDTATPDQSDTAPDGGTTGVGERRGEQTPTATATDEAEEKDGEEGDGRGEEEREEDQKEEDEKEEDERGGGRGPPGEDGPPGREERGRDG